MPANAKTVDEAITLRQRYEMMRSSLWTVKQQHEAHWRDCADFVKPRRPRFTTADRNKGDRRNQKIIDSTAAFASRTLQSGMHAGMTNPARPWLKLLTPDTELNEFQPVKEWLHLVTQRMLSIFARTNLYNALPVHYGDMGVFATAATAILDDDLDLFRAYSYPIGSYAIATNKRGLVDQWVYECQKSILEIVEEYLVDKDDKTKIHWERASNTVKTLWDRGEYHTMVDVCWMVCPNAQYDRDKLASKHLPYASVHIEKGGEQDDRFLRQSGYNEFPILVSRWDVTGEDWWGTDCPAMICLGDNKQLQTGEKRSLQAVEKMLNPPLQAPTHVRNQKASLLPGDITYADVREGQKGIHPIHEVKMPVQELEFKQEQTRTRIRRAFYEDLFLMLAYSDPMKGKQPVTATEIAERKEEKLIALGPVLERTNDELLDPLVDRVFAMMERANLIPPAPEELRASAIRVEFISILAQAQKLIGIAGHERFLQNTVVLMKDGGITEVRHKVDWMQAVDDMGDMLGINPKLLVPDDKAREAAAQANRAAQQVEAAKSAKDITGAVKNVADIDMEGDNALKRIAENMGAAAV